MCLYHCNNLFYSTWSKVCGHLTITACYTDGDCVCVAESPLQFYVNHASNPNVTAFGPGLSYGVANKTATFTVFTDDASEGTVATGGEGQNW